jgi:hypothetical protein
MLHEHIGGIALSLFGLGLLALLVISLKNALSEDREKESKQKNKELI